MRLYELPTETQNMIKIGLRKKLSGTILLFLLVFLSAGTLRYPQGWMLFGLFISTITYEILVFLPQNPVLFAQRSGVQKGTKRWDAILTVFTVVIFFLAAVIVGGLDFRNHWSPRLPIGFSVLGSIIWALGSVFTFWAMRTNTHFESTVRIQTDREHKVIDTGPYAIIRHPGYLGAILTYAVTPLILGSFWSMIPSFLSLFGFIIRTYLEDRTLQAELPGYKEFTKKTRFRLIPGLW